MVHGARFCRASLERGSIESPTPPSSSCRGGAVMLHRDDSSSAALVSFILGGVAGASLAVLFMPQAGDVTRRQLRGRIRDGAGRLAEGSRTLADRGRTFLDAASRAAGRSVEADNGGAERGAPE